MFLPSGRAEGGDLLHFADAWLLSGS